MHGAAGVSQNCVGLYSGFVGASVPRQLQYVTTCCNALSQVDTLSCLVERGVDINTKDNDGLKPVDLARDNSHEEAFKLLFKVTKSSLLVSALQNWIR